jgi:hypothetical protein
MSSSVGESILLVLESILEYPDAEVAGLDLELALLRKPELMVESSDIPESDGVWRALKATLFSKLEIGGTGGASSSGRIPVLEPARLLLRTGNMFVGFDFDDPSDGSLDKLLASEDCAGSTASLLSLRKGNVLDRICEGCMVSF